MHGQKCDKTENSENAFFTFQNSETQFTRLKCFKDMVQISRIRVQKIKMKKFFKHIFHASYMTLILFMSLNRGKILPLI